MGIGWNYDLMQVQICASNTNSVAGRGWEVHGTRFCKCWRSVSVDALECPRVGCGGVVVVVVAVVVSCWMDTEVGCTHEVLVARLFVSWCCLLSYVFHT